MNTLHGYAVVRIDEFLLPTASLENCVTVKVVFDDAEAAEREVERLNRIAGEGVRYFCQTTRLKNSVEVECENIQEQTRKGAFSPPAA
jgi:hypothetical protein